MPVNGNMFVTHSYIHMNVEQPSYVSIPLMRSTSLNDTFSGSALTNTVRDTADNALDEMALDNGDSKVGLTESWWIVWNDPSESEITARS